MVGQRCGLRALLVALCVLGSSVVASTKSSLAQDVVDAGVLDAATREAPEVPPDEALDAGPSGPPLTCVDDAFEPNQAVAEATPLTPGVRIEAVACSGNPDLYRFTPPAPAGALFLVTVDFRHALGDVDARLIDLTSGATVVVSESVSDGEKLVTRADGGEYGLLVYLFGGAGNAYQVDVTAVANDASNDCCTTSGAPGCSEPALSECVCLTDVHCCSESYDEVCVTQAAAACGAACPVPPPASDCCSAASSPGCSEPDVQACVCAVDPFCCGGRFDQSCANLARAACGASCPEGR